MWGRHCCLIKLMMKLLIILLSNCRVMSPPLSWLFPVLSPFLLPSSPLPFFSSFSSSHSLSSSPLSSLLLPNLSFINSVSCLSLSPFLLPSFLSPLLNHLSFLRNIEASLGTIATQINFFIHNLAQFKFSSQTTTHGLLSFSPSSYS